MRAERRASVLSRSGVASAAKGALSARLGVALAIDAKDENAARWYARFGAVALLDDPLKLILPLAVVAEAIAAATTRRR
jgi:hypothetical protein